MLQNFLPKIWEEGSFINYILNPLAQGLPLKQHFPHMLHVRITCRTFKTMPCQLNDSDQGTSQIFFKDPQVTLMHNTVCEQLLLGDLGTINPGSRYELMTVWVSRFPKEVPANSGRKAPKESNRYRGI